MSDGWIAGVFSVSVDMSANRAAGIPIVASAFSNQMDVVKAGINQCLTKDGQNVPTSVLPMGGYRHTGVGKAQALNEYQRVNEFIYMSPIYMVDTETGGGGITISCSTAFWPSTSAGMRVIVKNANLDKPSGGVSNIVVKVGSISANCSAIDGSTLWPGAFVANGVHEMVHDGTSFKLLNPGSKVNSLRMTVKGRTGAGVAVTVSGTVSVSCEIWRDINLGHFMLCVGSQLREQVHFQSSTATAVYLSTLPLYMRPTTTKFGHTIVYASTSTERFATVKVSTDGLVILNTGGGNYDVDCALFPFSITYPVK